MPYDIQIKVFDKEITIYNPGKLAGNLTFEDLKTDNYQAYVRNKLIAEAFYLTGDIEKYGSDFRRVREYVAVYPTMKTEFRDIPNGLLFMYSYTIQKNATQPPYFTPEKLIEKAVTEIKSNRQMPDKSGQKSGLSEKQVQILNEIEKNNFISRKELSALIGITQSTIQKHIHTLKMKNIIERIGPAKGGY